MNQEGFTVGASAYIDKLTYTYQTNSNKLLKVVDAITTQNNLGDFNDGSSGSGNDYSYDGNGNLTIDNNKAISSIVYNYLNLPQALTVTAKGNITYTYDAGGNKLLKTTVDNTTTPTKTTTTLYMGGIVYQNDTLQFIGHEEGRTRWALHKYTNGTSGYGFEYDYFLKDHLGNTRMVLTQEKDTAKYMATMEAAYRTTENQLFYNIPQSSYPRSAVSGYPTDNTTSPNDSLAKVNGSGQKIGPSIILKVMSGDSVDIAAKSYWTTNGNPPTNPSLTDALTSLANGMIGLTGGSKGTLAQLNTTGSPLYNALNSFINTNETSIANKPKAYLNWILLDEQFNYVNTYPQSGAIPVSNFAAGTLGTPGYSGIPITKSGYLYIWVSNESQNWDVFFDNLTVQHRTGPITEETHYYPFGLTMAGISSQAAGGLENKYKFNKGSELQHKEFSDGSGLELYATNFRSLDPQLGRWWQIDPKPTEAESPYASMGNNPVLQNDPLGDTLDYPDDPEFVGQFMDAWANLDAAGVGDNLAYLAASPEHISLLKITQTTIPSEYDDDGSQKLLLWNPTAYLQTKNGTKLTAAAILDHEADHGVQDLKNPIQYAKDSKPNTDKQYEKKEERRVITKREQKTALALGLIKKGQVTRTDHDGHLFKTSGPTTTNSEVEDKILDQLRKLHNDQKNNDLPFRPEDIEKPKEHCFGCGGPAR